MPTIEFTSEELQQLVTVLATASGPGINWMLTNNLLGKLQAAAEPQHEPVDEPRDRRLPRSLKLNSEDRDHATLPGT